MDLPLFIRRRLEELRIEQKDLARAAHVTESYISQLLGRKKALPAPSRTDIYGRMEKFLRIPRGELARLADLQRKEDLKRGLGDAPKPLLEGVRELILRKCNPDNEKHVRAIFEKQAFGELERLVTLKLFEVVKGVARRELENERWLRQVARLGGRSYEQIRAIALELLDTDILHVPDGQRAAFLDPLIESWDIDLATLDVEIVLNRRVVAAPVRRFEFVEREPEQSLGDHPGLLEFLEDPSLSGGATEEEIEFLRRLRFKGREPGPLYYYRELQSLRDPVHFRPGVDRAVVRTGDRQKS